jgi:hypothetical protein
VLSRFGRGFAAAWLIGAALAAAPVAAQTGSADPRLTPAPGIKVDEDFLVGVWSDKQDCSGRIAFYRDGGFVNQDGSRGIWRIEGDVLTLTGTSSISVRIVPQSREEITVVNPDDTLGYSRRCPNPL